MKGKTNKWQLEMITLKNKGKKEQTDIAKKCMKKTEKRGSFSGYAI